MLLGHWLEIRAVTQARGALSALAALLPDNAERITESGIEKVPLAALRVNDVILVRPGSRVPADGVVVEGTAEVDESLITGESRAIPENNRLGSSGRNGCQQTEASGSRVESYRGGDRNFRASCGWSPPRRLPALARRPWLTAQQHFFSTLQLERARLRFAYWWLAGDRQHALIRSATVLVIACPHALGLAIPLAIAISTTIGARNGLLVKDRLALERARDLDVVIFDKTGTLTRGAPVLSGVAVAPHIAEEEMLGLAAAVEADSEHPLAKAIVKGAARRGLKPAPAVGFDALPGLGARASVNGRSVEVGGPRLLVGTGATVPSELEHPLKTWSSEGRTVLYVLQDGAVIGLIAVEDEIRPESVEAVKALHDLGVRVAMITGDSTNGCRFGREAA